jgi:type IV pilus assembly protein PilV
MDAKRSSEAGFTIVEVIIAIIVLTVGLLGLVTTAALVTRMIGQGQRTAVASTFASQRMEVLRAAACNPALRVNGSESLVRGGAVAATNNWTFTNVAGNTWKITLSVTYVTVKNRSRTDNLETSVIC